jgi:gamma-glutamylcyclotransferase (GGCT)/AIG2-like uncharacterized protein YtfP
VEHLFVYGTLKRGGTAAHLMSEASFVGEGSICGNIIPRNGYAGLLPGDTPVLGDVFEIPQELFAQLDQYEGPGYVRRLTEVTVGGEKLNAWVYWLV